MTQSLIQHQSCQSCIFQRSYFCSLARVAHDCSLLINCLSPTHARPGSRTHVRVQGRNLCRFKHAHPGFRPSSIFVFSCIRKTTKSYFWTTQFLNARKRRQKHELLARSRQGGKNVQDRLQSKIYAIKLMSCLCCACRC